MKAYKKIIYNRDHSNTYYVIIGLDGLVQKMTISAYYRVSPKICD